MSLLFLSGQVSNSTTLFHYKAGESIASFINDSFVPMFVDDITFVNNSLKQQAAERCQGDQRCVFDVAVTRNLDVGENTRQINSQLVNETKILSKYTNIVVDLG